ncbi:unnamed protein product, partial [Anisakis simplex]|uniref:Transposase n=1 Tax=Anisakis simplex TaxID=6269 RepID=A0A0M3KJC1_ANISI
MWHDEVLVTNGDSIWGRMTALVTSLVGHRCTPRERADAYEQLLLSSIRDDDKQLAVSVYQSVPIESMINDAAGKLAKIEDKNRTADKFRRKIGLLRRNGDENDEILRFLLLMADWDGILNSTPKSLFELPLRDTSN